jgi:hypothetical protein
MSSDTASSPLSPHISSANDTSYSSESSTLQPLLQDAIEQYEKNVGTSLIESQFSIRLRSCDTIESTTEALEEQAHDFSESLGHDRHSKMMTSIRRVVRILYTVFPGPGSSESLDGPSGAVQVGHDIGSVVCLDELLLSILLCLMLVS